MQTQLKKETGKGKRLKDQRVLERIAKKLRQGVKYLGFEKELDKLLGTEMSERDLDAESAWEHYNKGESAGLNGK